MRKKLWVTFLAVCLLLTVGVTGTIATEESHVAPCSSACTMPECDCGCHVPETTGDTEAATESQPAAFTLPPMTVELLDSIRFSSQQVQLAVGQVSDWVLDKIEKELDLPKLDWNTLRQTYCFDIHAEDGQEVTVTIDGIAGRNCDVTVYHFPEENNYASYEVMPCTVNADGSVTFVTDSFSEFYFTVDFHYGDKVLQMPGEGSILLSEIFTELGIDRAATAAEDVVFSNENLVTTQRQENGDWLLTSLAPFQTDETLYIMFADGSELVLKVTDQYKGPTSGGQDSWYLLGSTDTSYNAFGTRVYYQPYSPSAGTAKITFYQHFNGDSTVLSDTGTNFWSGNTDGLKVAVRYTSENNAYWYHIYDTYAVHISDDSSLIAYQTSREIWNPFDSSTWGDAYIHFNTYSTGITLNNRGSEFCDVRIASRVCRSTETRNIVVRCEGVEVGRAENVLFPNRGSAGDAILVTARNVDKYRYRGSYTYDADTRTYYIDFDPITYEVTAEVTTGTLGQAFSDGIFKIHVNGGYYGNVSDAAKATGRFLTNTQYTLVAELEDGYVFDGWYDATGNRVEDGDGNPLTYRATMGTGAVKYTARAVQEVPLVVDRYVRTLTGKLQIITDTDRYGSLRYTGAGVSRNYYSDKHWYLVSGHGLNSIDTFPNTTRVQRNSIFPVLASDDTNAILVGTNVSGSPYYAGAFTYEGKQALFSHAGVGVNLFPLDHVYFDSAKTDQVWKYGYQWSTYYWVYNFSTRQWEQREIPHIVADIGIPSWEEGRINFVYEISEPGPRNYFLRYHPNTSGVVMNIPVMQSKLQTNAPQYEFPLMGLWEMPDYIPDGIRVPTLPYCVGDSSKTFVGWSRDPLDDPYDNDPDNTIMSPAEYAAGDTTILCDPGTTDLYAIWQDADYSITFDLNYWIAGVHDENNPNHILDTIRGEKAFLLTSFMLPDATNVRPGFTFAGWYFTRECLPGTELKTPATIRSDVLVYAKWVCTLTGTSMPNCQGDKYGSSPVPYGGIQGITMEYAANKQAVGKTTTGEYAAGAAWSMTAQVKDGFRFMGWYSSNVLDDNGRPQEQYLITKSRTISNETISAIDGKALGAIEQNTTYYAYAAEESLLAIDYYVRLSNGYFTYASDWEIARKIYGLEISQDYRNGNHWYLVAEHGVNNRATNVDEVTTVERESSYYADDECAILVGTNLKGDTTYQSYFSGKTDPVYDTPYYFGQAARPSTGHYYLGSYIYNGEEIPLYRIGVGLDLVQLDNVYYDAGMSSGVGRLAGQTWKYGYQWSTAIPRFDWDSLDWYWDRIYWEVQDIPIYEDEGRVNAVYRVFPKSGNNDFRLEYHPNLPQTVIDKYGGGEVVKIPEPQEELNIAEETYWFPLAGMAAEYMQPQVILPAANGQESDFVGSSSMLGNISYKVNDNFEFVGWSTDAGHSPYVNDDTLWTVEEYRALDANGRPIPENQQIETLPNRTTHLYAIWKIKGAAPSKYIVEFDENYVKPGNTEPDIFAAQKVNAGENAANPGEPEREGYVFSGTWYYTRTCTAGTEFHFDTPIQNHLVLYAGWVPADGVYSIHYYQKMPDGSQKLLYTHEESGTIGSIITVPAGAEAGHLDYKKPVGYKSGILLDAGVKINAEGTAVVNVLYEPDVVAYYMQAYFMDMNGNYLETPSYTKVMSAETGSTATAPINPIDWIGAEGAVFRFDEEMTDGRHIRQVSGDGSTVLKVYFSRKRADLVIAKDGMGTGESAIFVVTGKGLPESGLSVVVQSGKTVTIKGLLVGVTYTVTENIGWSWKYTCSQPSAFKLLSEDNSKNLVTFENSPKTVHWFTDEVHATNAFDK